MSLLQEGPRRLPPAFMQQAEGSPLDIESSLLAISPIDGRYHEGSKVLAPYMSEWGLMRARIFVEGELLKAYADVGLIDPLKQEEVALIDGLTTGFDLEGGKRIKTLEKKADHDVVAVVQYIKEQFAEKGIGQLAEFVHLGPTSEDIDNIAIRLCLAGAQQDVLQPKMEELVSTLVAFSDTTKNAAMVGRTHGQPAGFTTMGREMLVFATRLERQLKKLKHVKLEGKMNGIIGTQSGFRSAFPEESVGWWVYFGRKFVESFGLTPIDITSQGNPNDDIVEFLQSQVRFNNIVHGLQSDLWDYASRGMLRPQSTGAGSSTGAAKINPWRLEDGAAKLELGQGMAEVLIRNIAEYRLQRDLSDKTLLRFLGEVMAINVSAWEYTNKQIKLLAPSISAMHDAIFTDFSPLSEALQLTLRRAGVEKAYELVRTKTQGITFTPDAWRGMIISIIETLHLTDEALINNLYALSPKPFIEDAIALAHYGLRSLTD